MDRIKHLEYTDTVDFEFRGSKYPAHVVVEVYQDNLPFGEYSDDPKVINQLESGQLTGVLIHVKTYFNGSIHGIDALGGCAVADQNDVKSCVADNQMIKTAVDGMIESLEDTLKRLGL